MRTCKKCEIDQPLAAFSRDCNRRDGLHPYCKACCLAYSRIRRGISPERYFAMAKRFNSAAERQRAWRLANPEKHAATVNRRDKGKSIEAQARWRERNRESERARAAAYAKANPSRYAEYAAKRRAIARLATPTWADRTAIRRVYAEAARVTASTGVPHEVDHIVPLRAKRVCGLHVEFNLQVIPSIANARKSNRLWPEAA